MSFIDLIDPAVKGTVSILQSTFKYAPTVKRVVLTSSVASIWESSESVKVYDESCWNEQAIKFVEEKGMAAGPFAIYPASKTLAEKGMVRPHY